MKYVIEIIEVETCPPEWTKKDNWPGPGIYQVKSESLALYHVNAHGVNYISFPEEILRNPYQDQGEAVSEALLLKAIAAASRAEVLK
jgi:hypothetical protein